MPPENKDLKDKETQEKQMAAEAEKAAEEPKETPGEESELDKLRAENAALSDRRLRTTAEFDHDRKRSRQERDAIYPDAVASTVAKLLVVADSLERALEAPCTDEEYKRGIEKIYASFISAMEKLGVEEIKAEGEQFDPLLHNAVMHVEDESVGDGHVLEVLQKGYKMGDKVVRHSMVKVAN